jgi:hypothetical protein
VDLDQETGSSKKEWTRGLPERIYTYTGYISHVKATGKL